VIDINAGCGNWPFWPTRANDPASLESLLRAEGIQRACAYPLEAYLWPDPQEANELRLPELAASEFFIPSAVIDPTLPLAMASYQTCRREWRVPLIRLLPSYHLFDLDLEAVDELAQAAKADGVILGVQIQAEDKRNRNPIIVEQKEVPFSDIVELAARHPGLTVIAFGLAKLGDASAVLPEGHVGKLPTIRKIEPAAMLPDNLYVDLSWFEFEDSFETALKMFRADRLLLGTHAPVFYPKAAILKIERSAAPPDSKQAALVDNAKRILGL
jgi:predicted TIM-barrel fold metal-dependent hydrolase